MGILAKCHGLLDSGPPHAKNDVTTSSSQYLSSHSLKAQRTTTEAEMTQLNFYCQTKPECIKSDLPLGVQPVQHGRLDGTSVKGAASFQDHFVSPGIRVSVFAFSSHYSKINNA